MKYEQNTDNGQTTVNEPVAAYGATTMEYRPVQEYSDNKLDDILDNLNDEQLRTMPCQFTEKELDNEILLSEESGFMTNEEVKKRFAQWGYIR